MEEDVDSKKGKSRLKIKEGQDKKREGGRERKQIKGDNSQQSEMHFTGRSKGPVFRKGLSLIHAIYTISYYLGLGEMKTQFLS